MTDLDWDEELERILTGSPEVATTVAGRERARAALDRARAEVAPDLDVKASAQHDFSSDDTVVGIQIGLPIPLWNRNQGGIRKARAEATVAHQRVSRLALDLQSRLASVFQRYESARNQVEQYSREGGIIEKSERTLELIRTG